MEHVIGEVVTLPDVFAMVAYFKVIWVAEKCLEMVDVRVDTVLTTRT